VKHTISYTCVKGDTLTSLARKFNTTRKKLKALNDLASTKLKPGQVLLIPCTKSPKSSIASAKAKAQHDYLVAQPVQDFDVPASTFASCPVPLPSPDDDTDTSNSSGDSSSEKPAPIAQLVSPAEAAEAEREAEHEAAAHATSVAANDGMLSHPGSGASENNHPQAAPDGLVHHYTREHAAKALPVASSSSPAYSAAPLAPLPAPAPRNPFLAFFSGFGSHQSAADDWGSRFLYQARLLGDKGIDYDDDWRPPGENRAWTMDCSNTSRYLYQVTAGLKLPRTASDQYYYLHLQGKAWDVPETSDGVAECEYLRHHLKPGDLLFWENTYRPERQPPITHVMVFLGTNSLGQWIMAGSQCSRGGEHNRRNGGPDVYVFRPTQPCGGYSSWMGLVHHRGRFCAFGRPLEADPSKLAVVTDD
jgi:LysM repeat protein